MLAESSTGEPLAGFPRYGSNVVPSQGGTFLVQPRAKGRSVLPLPKIYFGGNPRRAEAPAANASVLPVMYAVEKSGDTRTTTALATGA